MYHVALRVLRIVLEISGAPLSCVIWWAIFTSLSLGFSLTFGTTLLSSAELKRLERPEQGWFFLLPLHLYLEIICWMIKWPFVSVRSISRRDLPFACSVTISSHTSFATSFRLRSILSRLSVLAVISNSNLSFHGTYFTNLLTTVLTVTIKYQPIAYRISYNGILRKVVK